MKKILVIEDEYPVRSSIRDLLEEKQYRVFTASDGKEGIQLAREVRPDLIICDVMMPCIDGHGVIRELNSGDDPLNVPFIFLTALAEMKDLREGMELGADDYLVKPFKALHLLRAVETRLEKYDKIRQAEALRSEALRSEALRSEALRSEALRSEASSAPETPKREVHDGKLREESRLFITSGGKSQFVKVSDIVCVQAESEYSTIFLSDGLRLVVRKLLKEWEESLPETIFLRIHRSAIINLNYIEKVEKWYQRSYLIRLKGIKEPVSVSQRYAARIRSLMVI